MSLTEAAEADKKQARIEFLKEIRQHALNDARGLSAPAISAKLRSPEFIKDWGIALSSLCGKLARKEDLIAIDDKRKEHALLRRRLATEQTIAMPSVVERLNSRFGLGLESSSLHEIEVMLLAEILSELKKREI